MPESVAHPGFPHVAALMPALNEAEPLQRLMPRLASFGLGQIIVGDNGSTDQTARVVLDHGGIVAHEPRRGYGAACWAAMQRIAPDIRVVLFLDADGCDDLSRIPDLVQPILDDKADLIIATRDAPTVEKGALSPQQHVGNWLSTRLIRLRWGYRYRDLGPFRAISKEALDRIQMRDRAFGWTVEMQIRALQENLRLEQISTHYRRRAIGPAKIGGSIRGSAVAAYWIFRTMARHW